MKRIILSFILTVIFISVYGQAPSSFNYQAIVRDGSGILSSRTVSFRLSILEGSAGGSSVYTEKQLTATDDFGLVHLQIGRGTLVSGDFAAINWSSHEFFLKIEIDIDGGESYTVMGTSQLISVPYSLFSRASESALDTNNLKGVLMKGNDANYQRINNLIIGNCTNCDKDTKGCIRYDTIEKKVQICDGNEWIDLITSAAGLPEDAVFVSPNGADTAGSGARKSPCRSITYGIGVAVSQTKPQVLVANGLYSETVTLVNGISLLGGYDPVTWKRNIVASFTMVSGTDYLNNHSVTILANNINQSTLFQGFVVYGGNAVIVGSNSYAVYVNGSNAQLNLSDNTIYCGNGAPGNGGTPGTNGLVGINGTGRESNPSGYDAFITTDVYPCNLSNNRQYSNGGYLSVVGHNISGGNGGGNRCPPAEGTEYSGIDGTDGHSGSGPYDGAGGHGGDAGDDGSIDGSSCYIPSNPMQGTNGVDGADGGNGSAGSGGLISSATVLSGHWKGGSGVKGLSGGNGGGGGGGGAGGGGDCVAGCSYDRLGGHGGGGGSGGGGGKEGYGGFAGGGSFGIFIVNSTSPGISNTSIFRGAGGNGGSGGSAGAGSPGGAGGNGGICSDYCWCYASAGKGGHGGNGGHGGGGGGGTGGSSIGIYTYNTISTPDYESGVFNNSFSAGQPGQGGYGGISYGNPGQAGQAGLLLSCSYN